MTDIKPPTEEEYRRDMLREALDFCPPIRPCKKCGWAVVDGYCCLTCGDPSPDLTWEQEKAECGRSE